MDFDAALSQAWNDHADDPRAVVARWPALQSLATDEPQIERVIGLVQHVHGVHLGEWQAGTAALQALRASSAFHAEGSSGESLRRALACLALCADADASMGALSASDRIRVDAMAADSLLSRDLARAAALLRQALDQAERSALADSDPMHRTLAAVTHNIACTLEEKADRSGAERALMLVASQASRHHWERAGTWLNVERAEYRLAMTWLQAGDPALARAHAQACIDIVAANDAPALERLFGWEALGLAARAAGDSAEHGRALAMARTAFAALSDADRGWCQASLDKLAADSDPQRISP